MPRLTSADYYHIHRQLHRFWRTNQALYANLSSTEQWCLHDYFQPSKDLSKDELLAHRAAITRKRPGLPHQAGRAYAKFQERAAAWALHAVRARKQPVAAAGPRSRKGSQRVISVRAVVRPEPDLKKLAQALVATAREMQGQKDDTEAKPPNDAHS